MVDQYIDTGELLSENEVKQRLYDALDQDPEATIISLLQSRDSLMSAIEIIERVLREKNTLIKVELKENT